jgi:drug/metabolite transporter (DMT)-like permease
MCVHLPQRVDQTLTGYLGLCQRLPRRKKWRSDPRRRNQRGDEPYRGDRLYRQKRILLKPMKEQLRRLPWKLIFILALIQLTRPILSTAGFFDGFRPLGPIIATAVIALIWISVAVVENVKEPVRVLAMAGASYAVIGVAMAVFLQAFFTWSPEETASIPLLLTAGLIGGIVVNVIWGALLGLVATGIKKAVRS